MCFVDEKELESGRIVSHQAVTRHHALNGSNSDVCQSRGLFLAHFDFDGLLGVEHPTVVCSLIYQLSTMSENEGLRRVGLRRLDAID